MPALLLTHSIWRWVVLILALAAVARALAGWIGRQPFGPLDQRLGQFYAVSLDIQVLLGLLLWIAQRWWSPLFAGAMASGQIRFFAFEHPFVMILALGIAHMGRALSRKAALAALQGRRQMTGGVLVADAALPVSVPAHRAAALLYLLSLALILSFIPWGGVPIR